MSTTLAPPPVSPPRPGGGGSAARRAIRRWAWRLLRREWRQQLLVLSLLTVAVTATTVGLGLVVNIQGSEQGVFGTANTRIEIGDLDAGGVTSDAAAARKQFGTVEAFAHGSVPVPGSITPVDLRDQDPHGAFGKPMLRLVSGRFPTGPDQAAVTRSVATTFSLKLGATWQVGGRPLTVVGIVENPSNLQDAFGLVAPGQIGSPTLLTLLFDSPSNRGISFRPPSGGATDIVSSGADAAERQRNQSLAVLLLATIGLTFIGLLSVAGFTVMAQRRMRALGMIGAIGATDRQVRRVMLANGAAVGIVGAAAGAAIGLAAWFALTPAFENVVGHRYDPLDLPWWAIGAGSVLAVLTAVAASWWPARAAAKLPIVAALSGRPVPPQPAHRFALLGTVLAAVGFIALVLSHNVHPALIVTGVVAISGGMLLLAPLGIRAVAAVSGRAPIAVRLALRDLGRYQSRSGAALAAASLAVGIAATIAVTAAAEQTHDHSLTGGNLPTNQLIVWLADPNAQGGPGVAVTRLTAAAARATPAVPDPKVVTSARSAADAVAQAVRGRVVELDVAVDLSTPIPPGVPPDASQANLVRPISVPRGHGWTQVATPYVATPAVLSLYRLSAGNLPAGTAVISARTDLGGVQLGTGFKGSFTPVAVQHSALLPNYASAPNTLITTQAVAAHGLTAEPVGWLVQSSRPFTRAQLVDAQHRAADIGVSTEARTGPDHGLQNLRDYATGVGMLVALGVLAMTVGLIRSETAGDLRTLTSAGASGGTRRTLNAASAGALAGLGAVLGTTTAYLALVAWHWHHVDYLDKPPYLNLAVLLFGLPVVAVIGAWLLGRTPKALGRRSLE